jgi:hypothetical protein
MHTAEPLLIPENETVVGNLRKYKSLGTNQIPVESIQVGGKTLRPEIHRLILFGIRKN